MSGDTDILYFEDNRYMRDEKYRVSVTAYIKFSSIFLSKNENSKPIAVNVDFRFVGFQGYMSADFISRITYDLLPRAIEIAREHQGTLGINIPQNPNVKVFQGSVWISLETDNSEEERK
jgi:hypothetical protein